MKLKTFDERFKYLKLNGKVGAATFGFDRILNQALYRSSQWAKIRNQVIVRDCAMDLAVDGHDILDRIIVHHMNPITVEDLENRRDVVFDPEFLICTSHSTHNAIHYGDEQFLQKNILIERTRNDMCPWL